MCGRSCLTLQPDDLARACKYKDAESTSKMPEYREEFNRGRDFVPTGNMCPGDVCPILISSSHLKEDVSGDERMLTTNNARVETINESTMYKPVLEKGKRCVIPVEGFYEWQTNTAMKGSNRSVYFIYMPQKENVKIETRTTWEDTEDVNLMYMAGLFDVWYDDKGDSVFSFTVLTFESDDVFAWLHHRTPAILETQEQIDIWLNHQKYPKDVAMEVIKHPKEIIWHQVSTSVNNSRFKAESCKFPIK